MTVADRPDVAPATAPNPWWAMSVVMAATVMVALDGTVVNVALHRIDLDLAAGNGIEWVVTSYLLAVCASQPATGWLSDRFGRRQVFLWSLGSFVVASALCAAATDLRTLVACRVLQGLGGGALMPVGMAMALDLFAPERRGRAMSTWGISAMAAPAIGPTVGGWLVTAVSWHWLFLINVPIGLATVLAGRRLLPDIGHRERRRFDAPGLLLGSGGLATFVLGVAQGSGWGWTAPPTVLCLVLGAAAVTGFVRRELRLPDPLIELRMFAQRSFRLSIGIIALVTGAQFARGVFVPLQLQSLRGMSALEVGTLLFVPAVATAVGMRIGGRLVDDVGPKRPIVLGCAGMVVSALVFTRFTLTTPVWVVVAAMAVQGLTWGMTTSPSMLAGLADLPPRLVSQGSAVRALAGQVAGALGVAVLGAVLAVRMGTAPSPSHAQRAYNDVFWVVSAGLVVALYLATRLPARTTTTPAPHATHVVVE